MDILIYFELSINLGPPYFVEELKSIAVAVGELFQFVLPSIEEPD